MAEDKTKNLLCIPIKAYQNWLKRKSPIILIYEIFSLLKTLPFFFLFVKETKEPAINVIFYEPNFFAKVSKPRFFVYVTRPLVSLLLNP